MLLPALDENSAVEVAPPDAYVISPRLAESLKRMRSMARVAFLAR